MNWKLGILWVGLTIIGLLAGKSVLSASMFTDESCGDEEIQSLVQEASDSVTVIGQSLEDAPVHDGVFVAEKQ